MNSSLPAVSHDAFSEFRAEPQTPLTAIIALCRTYRRLVMIWTVVILTLATVVIYSIKPRYMASAELVLDTRVQHLNNYEVMSGPLTSTDSTPVIRSEAKLLQNTALAGSVIDTLHLDSSTEFKPKPGIKAALIAWGMNLLPDSMSSWLTSQNPSDNDPERQRAALIDEYLQRLSVTNDGRSFTMSVSFWATDPHLASQIANTHVQHYIDEQRGLKKQADERAALWLGRQVDRLDADLASKESKLRDFREKSGLLHALGSTVVSQQVSRVSDEWSRALADLAQRQAKVIEVQNARGADTQSDVLNSNLIQRLRQQEADASKTLEALRSRYDDHSAVLKPAQSSLIDIRQKIVQETARIVSSMRMDLETARRRVATLSGELNSQIAQLVDQDKAEGRSAELEREVSAVRTVYAQLLGRQRQVEAQAGAETSDTRLVAPAIPAKWPYFPKKWLTLPLSLLMAVISGIGLAFLVDRMRGGIGRLDDLNSLGSTLRFQPIPLVSRGQRRGRSLPDYLLETPKGEFADSIRSLRSDIMHFTRSNGPRVLAITSALPGEGKTTMVLTMARSLASLGLRVLVIDCDLRRSKTAEILGGVNEQGGGTIAALQGRGSLDRLVTKDPKSSARLLTVEQSVSAPQDLLSTPALKQLLDVARANYDYVLIDTPPLCAVSDVMLIAPHVDATILLVRWKITPVKAVIKTIESLQKRGVTVGGVFLNAVNMAECARASGDYDLYRPANTYYISN